MPDSYVLGFGGTQLEIATFTQADGINFGESDLIRLSYTEAPPDYASPRQQQAGVRRMTFPMIFRASSPGLALGLPDAEAFIRKLAQAGAVLDLKPQGATSYTRFDVIGGRYEPRYNVHHNRENFRLASLRIDVQPFGYWPTSIILASVASVGLHGGLGRLAWSGSVIGDAPGWAKIVVQPTVASSIAEGSWMTDFLALSLTHQASHLGFLAPASLGLFAGASLLNDGLAPASQAVRYAASQNQGSWTQLTAFQLASALEPAHRGRYRAFGWFRVEPSQALPWIFAADTVPQLSPSMALASMQPVATVPPAVASGAPGAYGAQASPAYILADLGEIALPATPSGFGGDQRVRVWMAPASTNVGVASPVILCGGVELMPLDSDFYGVMPRGIAYPTILTPSAGKVTLDARTGHALLSARDLDLASANPVANAFGHYRGAMPRIASSVSLRLLAASRKTGASGATGPATAAAPTWASVSVAYTPRFQFMKGL